MSQRWADARAREYAKLWRISPYGAKLILATGYSLEGMEILAIFARLDEKRRAECKRMKQLALKVSA